MAENSTTPTATPEKEPVSTAPATSSDAPTEIIAPTDEDTFTQVDVKKLSPEMQAIHKSMLTDYKKKTSEVAQSRKEIEQRRKEFQGLEEKAKTFDRISSDPAFTDYWNGLSKAQQTQAKEEAGISDQEFNQAFESKENFSKFIQKVAQTVSKTSEQEIVNLKSDLMIKDFKAKNLDFDSLNEDRMIEIQIKADPRSYTNDPKQWQACLEDALKNARVVSNKWVEKGRKEGLARVSEKVSQSTNPPTSSTDQIYPGGEAKNLSVSEAVDLARRGIRVPRK